MRTTVLAALVALAFGCASNKPVPDRASEPAETLEDVRPQASEELDRQVFVQVAQQRSGEIQACYERALEKSPELRGEVLLRLSLGVDGLVQESRVTESTLGSPEVHQCIENAAAHWRFPPLPAGQPEINVEYPFVLAPSHR